MNSNMGKLVLDNQDFQRLVKVRRWISWTFLLLLLGLYLAFGMMSVYTPAVLAKPITEGSIVPFGIVMGYGILALTFITTLIYVWVANNYFAPLEKKIMAGIGEGS